MTADRTGANPTEAYVDAAAAALGLTIEPEWKANVAAFVDVARTMAARIEATEAAAASSAAPIFAPRPLSLHTR